MKIQIYIEEFAPHTFMGNLVYYTVTKGLVLTQDSHIEFSVSTSKLDKIEEELHRFTKLAKAINSPFIPKNVTVLNRMNGYITKENE